MNELTKSNRSNNHIVKKIQSQYLYPNDPETNYKGYELFISNNSNHSNNPTVSEISHPYEELSEIEKSFFGYYYDVQDKLNRSFDDKSTNLYSILLESYDTTIKRILGIITNTSNDAAAEKK